MKIPSIPFEHISWADVHSTEKPGETGTVRTQERSFGEIRVRMVQYSAGYLADHWCRKGHVLLCLEGEMQTELDDGTIVTLRPGTSYQVGDNAQAHRSSTKTGARLFIVD
jgi:quercetin dioxygenase-like cupin family protein